MPFARFEIEQIEDQRWHAEVEAGGLPGGPNFRRVHLNGESFEAIMAAVTQAYRALLPPEPAGIDQGVRIRPSAGGQEGGIEEGHELEAPTDAGATKAELLAYAEEHEIGVDKRWGEGRIRAAI